MKPSDSFSHLKSRKLSHAALYGCLLMLTMILVCVIKSSPNTTGTLSLQLSSYANVSFPMVKEPLANNGGQAGSASDPVSYEELQVRNKSIGDESLERGKEAAILPETLQEKQGGNNSNEDEVTNLPSTTMEEKKVNESVIGNQTVTVNLQYEEKQGGNDSNADSTMTKLPPDSKEKQEEEKPATGFEAKNISQPVDLIEKTGDNNPVPEKPIKESRVVCDFTAPRSDTCSMDGDVRVFGKSSTIMLASPPTEQTKNKTWKIRPYPRKWETTMERIKELTLTLAADPEQAPRCTVNHSVPAVLFSTGGFVGNYFHDLTDVIIPLFMTSRRFNGEVQLVVADFNYQFMDKYQQILKHLSRYQPINLDADDRVHCFPHAHVGLFSHRALGIDPSKSPNGISMSDFKEFLRDCFSLKRKFSKGVNLQSRRKPRLLLILRKGSRALVNEREVIKMVKGLGFKLITAGPEETKNISRFAQLVNSVDVLMGIHGAGLSNMIFLPSNATLVQIIPCCGLTDGCRYIFGEPAPDMGVRYVEYIIRAEESSLIEQYPRDHAVFNDPISIQKQQGFNEFWNIFLNKQKGLTHQGRKQSYWSSSLEMQKLKTLRSNKMKRMDMEMRVLNGFLLFFVMFWIWNVVGWRRWFLFVR